MSYQDTGLIFAGKVYIAPVEQGVIGAFNGPINVPSFELTPPSTEARNRISKQPATFGQALDVVNIPGDPAQMAITFDSLPAELLAEALGGTSAAHSVSAGSVVAETVTLVEGQWVKLANANIDGQTVQVTETTGSTSLGVGTDVELDTDAGLIKALNTGAATEVEVDYDYNGETGTQVLGATEIQKPRHIVLVGKNLATGRAARVIVHEAILNASEAMDLMSDEFVTGQLGGNLRTPGGKASPFEVVMLD
ncbi:hypothetical protein [Alcanivorax sp.]|uniref:phage tail tube protein n=1 Tax=Alcanivorax sp. TaxID=1872427 RepID=UPI003A8E3060